MSILKCKMCGGTLEVNENATTATCEYCGTEQTIPKVTDDVIGNLFNRANTLRLKSEFDKAEEIYNKIIETDSTQAEAYWGIILCKYGIEYVEDPKTFKRVPTCHRTSFEAITADEDYKLALQYADISQKTIYEAEAKAIDEIQKGILAICQNEKPYDVFICYKETDESGKRTTDSVIANDIYHQLTLEGFKVFYAAITLEDKLGQEYEPYIFAALNSAKVMLVIGSKPEYFTAVWVKNEWSRFMKLMKSDRSKLLIPCYKDMDAYELPEEFAHLQAQDMSKIGFINDVIRGIKKVVVKDELKAEVKETVVVQQTSNSNAAPLLKRAFMFLEDGEWDKADDFCEQVLNLDPECAEAYLGKLMAELKVGKQDNLKDCDMPFDSKNNYSKAYKFADAALKKKLSDYNKYIRERNETARKEGIYSKACEALQNTIQEAECYRLVKEFERIKDYKDSAEKIKECEEKAIVCHNDSIYRIAMSGISEDTIDSLEKAIKRLTGIPDWKDSAVKIEKCKERIAELEEEKRLKEEKAERDRIAAEKAAKKRKKITAIVFSSVAVCIAFVIILNTFIIPLSKYNDAITMMNDGKYDEAISAFTELGEFGDSKEKISEIKYSKALLLMNDGNDDEAIAAFSELGEYSDSKEKVSEIKYSKALLLMNDGNYDEAIAAFSELGEYSDSKEKVSEIKYSKALLLMNDGNYDEAIAAFSELGEYSDSKEKVSEIKYSKALLLMNDGIYDEADAIFSELGTYSDSTERIKEIREIEYAKVLSMMNEGKYDDASLIMLELINYDEYKEKINNAILEALGTKMNYIDKKYSGVLSIYNGWLDTEKVKIAVSFLDDLSCKINGTQYKYKIIDIADNSLTLEMTGISSVKVSNKVGASINNTIKVRFSDSESYLLIRHGGAEIRLNEE